jgi:hypothetical protein
MAAEPRAVREVTISRETTAPIARDLQLKGCGKLGQALAQSLVAGGRWGCHCHWERGRGLADGGAVKAQKSRWWCKSLGSGCGVSSRRIAA